jgi:hypothetical protein
MLKQKTILEIVKDEKTFQFHCDPDSKLGEIYDVLHAMKDYVVKRILEAEEQQKPKEKKDDVVEAVDFTPGE